MNKIITIHIKHGVTAVFAAVLVLMLTSMAFAASPTGSLESRVAHLEDMNQWLTYGGIVLLVIVLVQAAMRSKGPSDGSITTVPTPIQSSAKPMTAGEVGALVSGSTLDIIRARSLEIVDAEGKVIGRFGITDEGDMGLSLMQGEERKRLELSIDSEGGSGMSLVSADGVERLWLSLESDGTPHLFMYNDQGIQRSELAVDQDGGPRLSFLDAQNVVRAELTVDTDGSPGLGLYHNDENTSVSITVDSQGKPNFAATDKTGNTTWSAP